MHSHKLFDYDCIMQNPVQLNLHLFRELFEYSLGSKKNIFTSNPISWNTEYPANYENISISPLKRKFPEIKTPTGRFI